MRNPLGGYKVEVATTICFQLKILVWSRKIHPNFGYQDTDGFLNRLAPYFIH